MSLLPYAWAKSQRILLRPGEDGMLLTVCPSTPGWSISEVQRQFGQSRIEQVEKAIPRGAAAGSEGGDSGCTGRCTAMNPNEDLNVGGGLLPMRVCQPQMYTLTHRYRGQAPSHIWTVLGQEDTL